MKLMGSSVLMLCAALGWGQTRNQQETKMQTPSVRYLNRAPAGYSHIVEVRGGRTLYIAGQVSADRDGNPVAKGDFRAQVKQVFENLKAQLTEGGASFDNLVKLNYYLTDASDLPALREIRNSYINQEHPPASTLVVVRRLAREEFLLEIEAIAVTPD